MSGFPAHALSCGFTPEEQERFWSRVARRGDADCWLWLGRRFRCGYGAFAAKRVRRGPLVASRVAFALCNGAIPAGSLVCHRCDNPLCCNPAHLFLGTAQENMRDAHAKGRGVGARNFGPRHGSFNGRSKLTESDVLAIREARGAGVARAALARRFGVSEQTVYAAAKGLSWARVSNDNDSDTRAQRRAAKESDHG